MMYCSCVNIRVCVCVGLAILWCGASGRAQSKSIPEPMVFDLVRPLSAHKGELEVNSLFQLPLSGNRKALAWAPEIEYAFADGYAVELELPMVNQRVEAFKMALQGKLGAWRDERLIHGWQVIGKYNREQRAPSLDKLHLLGYRLNEKWSLFSMQGVRSSRLETGWKSKGVSNLTLFYELREGITSGVETNLIYGAAAENSLLLMPQMHLDLGSKQRLQFGFGVEKQAGQKVRATTAMRIIVEF